MAFSKFALVPGIISCVKGSRVLSIYEDTSSLPNYNADRRSGSPANYLAEVLSVDNPIQVNESSSGESLGSNTPVLVVS